MVDAPPAVQEAFDQLDEPESGYLQLKQINGRYYVHRQTNVWDPEAQQPKKVSEHYGAISPDGEFTPKTPRTDVQITDREIFEFSNGRLAYHLLEDVHEELAQYTPYADEVVAMAIVRAIDPKPLRLHPSRWEKLYLSEELDVSVSPKHLSSVLSSIGKGKAWWHEFFRDCFESKDILLYDLTTVFSRSQNIKRAEKGYNPDHLYIDQLGVILAFSTATNLPAGVDVFWGSMKDITTFEEFLEFLDPEDVGFIVDRGLFKTEIIEQFRENGINYVVPLRKNSTLIDLRWLDWQQAFTYRDRSIRWARRHEDLGTVYIFDDPALRGDQQQALLRKNADGDLSTEAYEDNKEQAGIVAILSDLDRAGEEMYDLYKGRHEVELAFDAMKNQLEADKTHLQSDEAVRGYFFVTFLALRVYFAVLTRLREADKTGDISVEEVFWELSKVERVVEPNGTERYAEIPKAARDVIDLFPEALPRG